MPDIDPRIPLGVQSPMSSLGSFLDVAKSATALKAGQIANESNQKVLEERNNVRALFQNPQQFMGDDGNFDYNKVVGPLMEAAPTTGGDILTKLFQGQREASIAKQSILQLGDAQRASVGQWLLSQAQAPGTTRESVEEGLGHLEALIPTLKPAASFFRKSLLANAGTPEALKAALMQAGQSVMGPAAQVEAMTPGGLAFNTGQVSGQINTKPMAGPAGPIAGTMTQNVVPPTQTQTTRTDAMGNPIIESRDPRGVITLEPARTAGGAPGAASVPPMFNFPPGESKETANALMAERQGALATLRDAPLMHQNTRGILENIDKVIATGTAGPTIQQWASRLGIPSAEAEKAASAYDLVGKYLERNALQAAQAMGPHTNAGLESQVRANGSVAYNPTAIKKLAKLNDAIVTGAEHYQPGLERAIQLSPNQIFAKREFDQAWAQNFDVRVMELFNAQTAGDKAAVEEVLKSVGGRGSKGAAELARKAINLEKLSAQGRL